MAGAALVLSIKLEDPPTLLPAAEPLLFTPASESAAESAHTVAFSTFPSVHLLQGIKVIKCTGEKKLFFFFKRGRGINLKVLQYSPVGGGGGEQDMLIPVGPVKTCPEPGTANVGNTR